MKLIALCMLINMGFAFPSLAQAPISTQSLLSGFQHGMEQYQQGHYDLAIAQMTAFLDQSQRLPIDAQDTAIVHDKILQAKFYLTLSQVKGKVEGAEDIAISFIENATNPNHRQRVAYALAQHYFYNNQFRNAIPYYELAGIQNLSNEEIADNKFELAYCYFINQEFDKSYALFGAIKELPEHKYFYEGNYYYGLLAYQRGNYDDALRSFKRIHNLNQYKEIVPYYEAEIYYFKSDYDNVLAISRKYINKKEKLYYDKELHLLTGQTYFEQKKYKEALPYFQYYYDNTDKIRKEILYEFAYTNYRLENWKEAIEQFKPLSNAQDSLGQTSMYLLGDCYLKLDDKKGAKNAFQLCADMDFNASQKEAASFLAAKLSYELGDELYATRSLHNFITTYPNSTFKNEAHKLLASLLARSSNFAEAFAVLNDIAIKDHETWEVFQKVAVGRGTQLMQSNNYGEADSVFSFSLQQPISPAYESIAYFWKAEIAYQEGRYAQTVQFINRYFENYKTYQSQITTVSPRANALNAYTMLGFAEMQQNNYNGAQAAFAKAKEQQKGEAAIDLGVREADALFMQQQYAAAARGYEKAMQQGDGYAMFQRAMIYGLEHQQAKKMSLLQDLARTSSVNPYKYEAMYELALGYLDQNQPQAAIDNLQTIENTVNAPQAVKAKAAYKLGYAYQSQQQSEKAIAAYQSYLKKYTHASDVSSASEALRNLYIEKGNPEGYLSFLKSNNLNIVSDSVAATTYYEAAELAYANKKYDEAISAFTRFLQQYPNSVLAVKAHYYRGESYRIQKRDAEALNDYDKVVTGTWNEFVEDASLKAAYIASNQNDAENALRYYEALRAYAMDSEKLKLAYLGLAKNNFLQQKYSHAYQYADTLLSIPDLNKVEQAQALLCKGQALMHLNKADEAVVIFTALDKENIGAISAEARYLKAQVLYEQKKYTQAEEVTSQAIKASAGYEVWVIKSYLLLADILSAQKDFFNAKATLQSLVNHVKDPELLQQAKDKLQQVQADEAKNSKLYQD